MIESTPTASGAAVEERPTQPSQPVVEAGAGRQAEEPLHDTHAQPRQGSRPMGLQREQVPSMPREVAGGFSSLTAMRQTLSLGVLCSPSSG